MAHYCPPAADSIEHETLCNTADTRRACASVSARSASRGNIRHDYRRTTMQSPQALYADKLCSASDALDLLRDGDMIIVPTGVGEPPALLTALSEQRRRFHDIKVAQILAM